MKKITAILLALLMCLPLCLTVGANGTEETKHFFSITSGIAKPGDQIKLTVKYEMTEFANSIAVYDFKYDTDALELVKFTGGSHWREFLLLTTGYFDNEKKTIIIGFADTIYDDDDEPITFMDTMAANDYTLCTAVFNVKKNAPLGNYDITASTLVKDGSDVKGSEFKAGSVTVTDIETAGAQIRIPAGEGTVVEQGLRFTSSIEKSLYDSITKPADENATGLGFGTVVIPSKKLAAGKALTKETKGAVVVPAVKLFGEPDSDKATFTACMTGLIADDSEYLCQKYTVVAYATTADGTVYGEAYETSVFDIALAAVTEKGEDNATLTYLYNNILKVVNPEKYNDVTTWAGI